VSGSEVLLVIVLVAALALPIVVVVGLVNRRVDGTTRPGDEIAVTAADYLWFVDEALDGMVEIVRSLGNVLANRQPDLPRANSPYALLTHCLGVMEFWGGHAVAGRIITRDRDAEFVAVGEVDELIERVRLAKAQLRTDLREMETAGALFGEIDGEDRDLPVGRTQGGALFHIYEELAQHRGQMEITRDVLLAAS
jgi:hypothetical protein